MLFWSWKTVPELLSSITDHFRGKYLRSKNSSSAEFSPLKSFRSDSSALYSKRERLQTISNREKFFFLSPVHETFQKQK